MTREHHDPELDRRVDEVRDRLRGLGYLKNPLESFVAGRGARTPSLRTVAGVAVRLGVVGGILVALLIWLATVAINPAITDRPRDLIVLAAYLFAIYAVIVAAIGLVVGSLILLVVRLAGPTARLGGLPFPVGALATLLTFLYGTVWWRWVLFSGDALALGAWGRLVAGLSIVLLSLLLGRLATLSAALLVVAGAEGRAAAQRRKHRESSRAAAVGLVAFALVLAYFIATGRRTPGSSREATPFTVSAPATPLVLIGIDGLSWESFHFFADAGEFPNVEALVARSVRAPLDVAGGGPPPEVWTTIGTGETSLRHGVRSFVLSRLTGMQGGLDFASDRPGIASALETVFPAFGLSREIPVSGLTRTRKAIWEIVSEKGFPAGAVNWWATWPAAPDGGAVVSERAFARLTRTGPHEADLTSDVSPVSIGSTAAAVAESALADVDSDDGIADPHDEAGRLAAAGDLFAIRMAARLLGDAPSPLFLAVYLPGLDILSRPLIDEGHAARIAALDVRLAAIRRHVRRLDREIGGLVVELGDRAAVAVVTTPGGGGGASASGAEGLVAMCGEGVAAGTLRRALIPEEVAPTILAYIGFPASLEMAAAPRTDLFSEEFATRSPVSRIASFGTRQPPAAGRLDEDEEFLERLRSLGYIR